MMVSIFHVFIGYLYIFFREMSTQILLNSFGSFLKDFIYLFLQRGGRRRETLTGCLLHIPNWGPGLQPRHVPGPGIEQVTLWFIG